MGKFSLKKRKRVQLEIVPKDDVEPLPKLRKSDDPIPKKDKWTNKQRVLVFGARGISYRDRHLMKDLKMLMPHHRTESKMERSKSLSIINEMAEMKHCNKAVLFEGRRKRDLYMWISNIPNGPSAKFLVENIHTMGELKMTGNCLRGSRPLLSFDETFDGEAYLLLLKEMLTQTFGVPNHHPKSQPFYDHIYTFTFLDNRIWFRNFQILSEDGALAEVGPRFVLNPVKIFEGSFTGGAIWDNPDYISPARYRQTLKKAAKDKYLNRMDNKATYEATRPKTSYVFNELDEVFEGDAIEKAMELSVKEKKEKTEKPKKKKEAELSPDKIKRKIEKLHELLKVQKPKKKKTGKANVSNDE